MMIQPANTHLAQLNVATALDDLASPRLSGFVSKLNKVNAVAERSPGFVWRLKDETGSATSLQFTENPLFIVNLSVWETPEDLEHFVWNTVHKRVYDRKADWFQAPEERYFVMWWISAGKVPTPEEALAKLDDINKNGPSERAFGWESLSSKQLWKKQQCA